MNMRYTILQISLNFISSFTIAKQYSIISIQVTNAIHNQLIYVIHKIITNLNLGLTQNLVEYRH
mgnify:CR=1 FL=1